MGRKRRKGLARIPLRYYGALALYLVLGAFFIHDWDGFVFEQSVRDFWDGYSPYSVAEDAPYYTFLNEKDNKPQWYAYPPLPLLGMSVSFLPEHFVDVPPVAERILLKLPMVLGTLALAAVGGAWARHLGKDAIVQRRVERLLLFNPFLVLVGPMWGMTDPALVAFFLGGALRFAQGRHHEAGLWFACSVLIKPFPVLLALPLVAYYIHTDGWRPIGRVLETGSPLVALVCGPFLLANPRSFWTQVIDTHLRRDPQGLTIWSVSPLNEMTTEAIGATSFALFAIALLVLSLLAPRLSTPVAPILLLLATSAQLLLWNRVVNEQYLVLVVAPLVLLYGLGVLRDRISAWAVHGIPLLFGLITVFQGFHFLRFIPPDMEWILFGTNDVTRLANRTRQFFSWGWPNPFPEYTPAVFVALCLLVVALLSLRYLLRTYQRPRRTGFHLLPSGPAASALGCLVLLLLGLTPLVSPAAVGPTLGAFAPATDRPLVGAFYYLWWNNPAHNPNLEAPYGNWAEASQFPELGYYTQTRGVSRAHAQMMRENGIDVAVVSYHTGEQERYQVFQEEARKLGILVAPLIELNQIYDQPRFKSLMPLNASGQVIDYGSYRLTEEVRHAIRDFVLEVGPMLRQASSYREDGRPVIFFYDSYVSGVGVDGEERQAFLDVLSRLEEMRNELPALDAYVPPQELDEVAREILAHYPKTEDDLHKSGLYGSVSRITHLEQHREFWRMLRQELESELGPLFLVSGDAFNERAGFETGTIKSIINLGVFDGSFIYSPSFTWGVQPKDYTTRQAVSFEANFHLWENRNLWLNAFAAGLGRYSAFGVAPSYDDTGLVYRKESFIIPAYPYGAGEYESSTYHRSWSRTLLNPPNLVVLATFNEFFEGSSVEPSKEYGPVFLNKTRDYRNELQTDPPPPRSVVTIVHERSSRLHPGYNDRDLAHDWGLNLTAAAGRVFGGHARLAALDALETTLVGLERELEPREGRPDVLLVDGGRANYSWAEPIRHRVEFWTRGGVPTLVLGPKVALPLGPTRDNDGDVLGLSCKNLGVELSRDTLRPGDRLFARQDEVWLTNADFVDPVRVAYRCPERTNLGFASVKPWSTTGWQNDDCLHLILRTLFPAVTPEPGPAECAVVGYQPSDPSAGAGPGTNATFFLPVTNPGTTPVEVRLTVEGLDSDEARAPTSVGALLEPGASSRLDLSIHVPADTTLSDASRGPNPFTANLWIGQALADQRTLYLYVHP